MITTMKIKAIGGAESAEDILNKPYSLGLVRQPDGTWVAEIREIPGCYATGDTQGEALEALNSHAVELIDHYLKKGQHIPPPLGTEFSGNFALRMPKGLHQRAAHVAMQERTSLNQFIVSAIAERVGYVRKGDQVTQQVLVLNASLSVVSESAGRLSSTAIPRIDIPGEINWQTEKTHG